MRQKLQRFFSLAFDRIFHHTVKKKTKTHKIKINLNIILYNHEEDALLFRALFLQATAQQHGHISTALAHASTRNNKTKYTTLNASLLI